MNTKRIRKSRAKKVEEIIDQTAEMATSAADVAIVDHGTQVGSWMPTAEDVGSPVTDDAFTGEETPPELTAEEESAVQALEASEAVHAEPAAETPAAPTEQIEDFDTAIQACDETKVEETVWGIANSLDDRAIFEKGKHGGESNIQKTIAKARKLMVTKRAAKVLMVTNVDPQIMNRSIHEGARYNVYAIGKLADLVYGLTGAEISNAINRAVTRSLFQCKNGGVPFTGELAKAAASDKIRIEPSLRKFLVSHTVSASTAPTQASSTMQALETLGVVKVEGSRKHPTYTVLDTPVARKLEELVLKAA